MAHHMPMNIGPAKNHPWILTTLGCPEPLTQGIPQSRNSRAEESLDRGLLGLSLQGWSISPQGVLRNLLTEELLRSGVPGHPSVVSIEGWFLAGPRICSRRAGVYSEVFLAKARTE